MVLQFTQANMRCGLFVSFLQPAGFLPVYTGFARTSAYARLSREERYAPGKKKRPSPLSDN